MILSRYLPSLYRLARTGLLGLALGAAAAGSAQAAERAVDPKAAPDVFLTAVANNMLDAVKADPQALQGDIGAGACGREGGHLGYADDRRQDEAYALLTNLIEDVPSGDAKGHECVARRQSKIGP